MLLVDTLLLGCHWMYLRKLLCAYGTLLQKVGVGVQQSHLRSKEEDWRHVGCDTLSEKFEVCVQGFYSFFLPFWDLVLSPIDDSSQSTPVS